MRCHNTLTLDVTKHNQCFYSPDTYYDTGPIYRVKVPLLDHQANGVLLKYAKIIYHTSCVDPENMSGWVGG